MVNLVRKVAVVCVAGLQKTEPSWVLKPVRMGMRRNSLARKRVMGRAVMIPSGV